MYETGVNPFAALAHSRKFWLMMLDLGVSLSIFFITKYAAPSMAEDALYIIATIQPVFVFVIGGIAWEDAAAKRAGLHPSQGGYNGNGDGDAE